MIISRPNHEHQSRRGGQTAIREQLGTACVCFARQLIVLLRCKRSPTSSASIIRARLQDDLAVSRNRFVERQA
jgi:hypothetical protein